MHRHFTDCINFLTCAQAMCLNICFLLESICFRVTALSIPTRSSKAWFWQWIQDLASWCHAGGLRQDPLISSPLYPPFKTTTRKAMRCAHRGNSPPHRVPRVWCNNIWVIFRIRCLQLHANLDCAAWMTCPVITRRCCCWAVRLNKCFEMSELEKDSRG